MGWGPEALDVALGLLRAPALRTVLRGRPLPGGVGEVLAIASGSADRARSAAERTGHDEAELLEAARFYVQQILLTEDADAYRTLGAERGAGQAILRDHHRHLLRWLHPDRSPGADWDSTLSTRVNQAWNQLRTDAARAEYDAALAMDAAPTQPGAANGSGGVIPAPIPYPAAHEHIDRPPGMRAGPVAVALLGLACVVLAWFAIDREDAFENLQGAPSPKQQIAKTDRDAALHLSELRHGVDAVTARAAAVATPPGLALAAPTIIAPLPAAAPALAPPSAGIRVSELSEVASPVPEIFAAAARTTTELQADTPAPPVRAFADAAQDQIIAAPMVLASTRAPEPPAMTLPLPTLTTARKPVPIAEPPVRSVEPLREEALATELPSRPASPRATAPSPPEEVAADALQLFREAEDALRSVTSYLAIDGGTEPRWLDRPTGLAAADIRSGLRARHQGRARARMELETPNWTLGSRNASMLGSYRLGIRKNIIETGVLRVELTRIDRQWQVASLSLDPAL